MSALLPVLLAGGGIAYVAATASEAAPYVPPTGYTPIAPSGGSTIQQASSPPTFGYYTGGSSAMVPLTERQKQLYGAINATVQSGWGYTASQTTNDPALQAKLDAIEAYAKKTHDDMNEVAKSQAADKLNKELKLDPPLTGREDWKTVSAVVGGAAGAAAGGAVCGPPCAKVGALAGAYLGAKLGDLLERKWEDVKDWLDSRWSDVKDTAEDAYDFISGLNPF